MRHLLAVALLAATAAAAEFTTRPAQQAAAAYERDVQRANDDHAKALEAARRKYADALDDAAKSAAKAGNLEEVNRISEERKRLDAAADGRTLWVHDGGFYQRLADGSWAERTPTGSVNRFDETARSRDFIELTKGEVSIRLSETKSDGFSNQKIRSDWCYRGAWQSAD